MKKSLLYKSIPKAGNKRLIINPNRLAIKMTAIWIIIYFTIILLIILYLAGTHRLTYNGLCKKCCAFLAIHYPGTQPLIKSIEAKSSKICAMFFTLCYR